jgi:malonyl-CoA decarboxylase
MTNTFLGDLLQTIAERGRALIGRGGEAGGDPSALLKRCEALLGGRGEATGVALAAELLDGYARLDADGRRAFLMALARDFGPDPARLDRAIEAWRADPSQAAAAALHEAAEPRRQDLFRRLNHAPGGTERLVRMREDLLRLIDARDADSDLLKALDADFVHLFSSWFNRGFLVLRRIDWRTPANVLEKIIRYEAVHAIESWDDLRRRIEPADRRLFAFFHPRLGDEPLIFVEVALTGEMPDAIAPLLAGERVPMAPAKARTAAFYSISNCQEGLRGISFGNFLIKQVVEELARELPGLDNFVTLSPVPGFARWLAGEREAARFLAPEDAPALALLDKPGWHEDGARAETLRKALLPLAASYFTEAKTPGGRPVDPVARFHLGNGARLERLDWLADLSPKALKQSHGLMVNYLYKLADIEKNHEAYAEKGEVVAAYAIRRLALKARAPAPAPEAAGTSAPRSQPIDA